MIANSVKVTVIRFPVSAPDRFVARASNRRLGKRLLAFLLAAFAGTLAVSCARQPIISDIQRLPQDATFYLTKGDTERPLLDSATQLARDEQHNQVYFSPWHRRRPLHDKVELVRRLEKFRDNPGYGENKQPHSRRWVEQLASDMTLETYPNAGFAAITSVSSDLRELPTNKPHFNAFDLPGEGYPFDNFQYSAIPANTPIFVSHLSADRSWMLVESHYGLGWMMSSDAASVDGAFIDSWEVGRYVAIIKDDSLIYDDAGRFLFTAPVGLVLPIATEEAARYRVLVAVSDENRCARIREVSLTRDAATRKPMLLTASNVASLANKFMNQTYGWGGLYGDRDCSATMKDLFAPFGYWLPRNSSHQAHQAGTFTPLGHLQPAAKMSAILAEGVPFLTLLWAPGHIALYIGNYGGEPVVFHNLWGIRTRDWRGREGRQVVGHAVITTLHLGKELKDADSAGTFLARIEGMTTLGPPENVPHADAVSDQ